MGLTGQTATVDELLTGRENLALIERPLRPRPRDRQADRRRPARAVLAHRCRRPGREDLLRWHAAAPRPGRQPGGHAAGAVPRRADDRSGPAKPCRAVARVARAGARRHHAGADHPIPRGGRPARRSHRRDRPRPDHRRRAPRSSSRTVGRAAVVVTVSHVRRPTAAQERAPVSGLRAPRRRGRAPAQRSGRGPRRHDPIAAAFDGGGIELDDLGLKRPSLDDVFLRLTGHRAEEPIGQVEEEALR